MMLKISISFSQKVEKWEPTQKQAYIVQVYID